MLHAPSQCQPTRRGGCVNMPAWAHQPPLRQNPCYVFNTHLAMSPLNAAAAVLRSPTDSRPTDRAAAGPFAALATCCNALTHTRLPPHRARTSPPTTPPRSRAMW